MENDFRIVELKPINYLLTIYRSENLMKVPLTVSFDLEIVQELREMKNYSSYVNELVKKDLSDKKDKKNLSTNKQRGKK